MSSAAEQLAANFSFSSIAKAKGLQRRLLFTLLALVVYRIGTYIPLPGVDPQVVKEIFSENQAGIMGMFNMFSGGALGRMTIFALNIVPYISAAIIMQLLTAMVPSLEALKKEGASGRHTINQYTRYGTVFLAAIQGYAIALSLESVTVSGGFSAVLSPGLVFRASTVLSLVGGTMFLMWIGEQITQRGIGNGISLIIYSGIVANLPVAIAGTLELGRIGSLSTFFIMLLFVMVVLVITFTVFMERAQRRITVQYPKRQVGNRLYAGDNTHLPLKLNTAGVIPPIFASSILLLPLTITSFLGNQEGVLGDSMRFISSFVGRGQPLYLLMYVGLIVFFCFFYTTIVFNAQETAENLRKNNGFIPGIRPGASTENYLNKMLMRLTLIGAAYLSAVCILPEFLVSQSNVSFYFGGTSLLIVVSVTIDTVSQFQSHLLGHQYESLLKKARGGKAPKRGRIR
jgi:preprotein translocase subunit SecY